MYLRQLSIQNTDSTACLILRGTHVPFEDNHHAKRRRATGGERDIRKNCTYPFLPALRHCVAVRFQVPLRYAVSLRFIPSAFCSRAPIHSLCVLQSRSDSFPLHFAVSLQFICSSALWQAIPSPAHRCTPAGRIWFFCTTRQASAQRQVSPFRFFCTTRQASAHRQEGRIQLFSARGQVQLPVHLCTPAGNPLRSQSRDSSGFPVSQHIP